jgi:hypothetical protein
MKTLNRPMFRYGGPIKEGVMNGIREPKRNGGSMGEPQAINTVGSPLAPQGSDGRQQYAVPILYGLGAGAMAAGRAALRFAPQIARGAKRIFGKTTTKPAPYTPVRTQTTGGYSEYGPANYTTKFIKDTAAKGTPKGLGGTEVFTPNILGRDPLIKAGGKIISAVTNPAVTGKLASAARLVLSPSGAVIGGLYYANGKFFNKNNEEVNPPKGDIKLGGKVGTSGAPGGGDPDMMYNAPEKELTAAEREALEAESRMKKMDKYKEIMDIKGMNKDAAYKSLIDASKIIQEGGNLKKQLKDGSLITNITAAASKRFDKVSDTENALRSLIAKGEITKEMNKEENALAKLLKQKQIEIADKSLAGKSMAEIISTRMEKGDMFQGSELASLLRVKKGIDAKVLPSGKMEQGQDPLDYITQIVATTNADETTPDYPDGVYVIKDRIIQVLEGQVIPVSINQLT